MISEQTACKRQSAADARYTGCTPMMPLIYLYFSRFPGDFQASFFPEIGYFFLRARKRELAAQGRFSSAESRAFDQVAKPANWVMYSA